MRLFVLGAAFLASGAAAPTQAAAQSTAVHGVTQVPTRVLPFDIPPGALERVAADFERVTDLTIVFADAGLAVIQSPGVSGTFTSIEAIDRLLSGTSVEGSVNGSTVTLRVSGVKEVVAVTADARPASPKYTQPLRDTPQTIVVIPQTVFQEQSATSLRDALRNTPGITLAAGEGGAAPATAS
jgi:catecholate siderophore receptor